MPNDGSPSGPDQQVARADQLCQELKTRPTQEAAAEGAGLLQPLRDLREFGRLCMLGDLVCRFRPDDAKARRLYAQGLIESGHHTVAIGLIEAAMQRYGEASPEGVEFEGLLGRAYKQLLVDTNDPQGIWAGTFLERAFAAYSGPYERKPEANFWHGINLAALAHAAKARGLQTAGESAVDYAAAVLGRLETIPPAGRDQWWLATKAEAHAARAEWALSEQALRAYIEHPKTEPFMLASTLRQLRELWAIQREPRGARLSQILEATLMSRPKPGAVLTMGVPHLLEMRALQPKNDEQLQRVVGPKGFETVEWYRAGLDRAASVAAIKEKLGLRIGTGFAVKAAALGVEPGDEVLVLTNFHVLNSAGLGGRTDFGNVEVVFEAIEEGPARFTVRAVVAESPADGGLDYALLRLVEPCDCLQPVPMTRAIAAADSKARTYVIGYPLGDVLQFSMHHNELLDHECKPTGKPPNEARRRVHYSTSTEKGNSGSPVFDDKWDCIALHHAGGKRNPLEERYGIARLNGLSSAWEANEGMWIGSIEDDVKAKKVKLA